MMKIFFVNVMLVPGQINIPGKYLGVIYLKQWRSYLGLLFLWCQLLMESLEVHFELGIGLPLLIKMEALQAFPVTGDTTGRMET